MYWLEGGQSLQQPSAANDMWSENTVVYKYDLQTLAMNLNSRLEKHERQLTLYVDAFISANGSLGAVDERSPF